MKYLKILFSLAITFTTIGVNAQNNQKGIYTDSLGNVFVQPNLKLKLYIGTTIDGENALELINIDGDRSPIIWNGSGLKTMKHVDLFLGRSIIFELHADGIAPQTAIIISKYIKSTNSDTLYIKGGAIIDFKATDKASGVLTTYYSINNEPEKEFTTPISLDNEGKYSISAYSIDNLGNKEDKVTRNFIVDNTAPSTTLSIDGDQYDDIVSGRSHLVLKTFDNFGVKELMYRIDSSEQRQYVNPINTMRLLEGEHTISWFATDNVGNIEKKQSYKFYVDKTPPLVFEEIVGNTYMINNREFSSGRSQLKIAAVDNKSGIKEIFYSLNGTNYVKYEKPVTLSEILGTIKVKSYAVDKVNNRSQSGTSSETFNMPTIDITGPQITYKLIGSKITVRDTTWISPNTQIQIKASDRDAGVNRIIYRINNAEENTYLDPIKIEENGFYSFKCTAFDHVENLNFLNFELGVDNIAPELFVHFSVKPIENKDIDGETIPVYSKDVRIFLAATDNLSGDVSLSFSINQGKSTNYSSPIQGFVANKINTLNVTVKDNLGNIATKTYKFWILE